MAIAPASAPFITDQTAAKTSCPSNPYTFLTRVLFGWWVPQRYNERWVRCLPNTLTIVQLTILWCLVEVVRTYRLGHLNHFWWWVGLCGILALFDAFDGGIARIIDAELQPMDKPRTKSGKWLDPMVDKVVSAATFWTIWVLLAPYTFDATRSLFQYIFWFRMTADILLGMVPLRHWLLGTHMDDISAGDAGKMKTNWDRLGATTTLLLIPAVGNGTLQGAFVAGMVAMIILRATYLGFRSLQDHLARART